MRQQQDTVNGLSFWLVASLLGGSLNAGKALAQTDSAAVAFAVDYTSDVLTVLDGGIDESTAYLDNLDLTLELDAEALWGVPGTRLFAYGLYNNGEPFSENLAGDSQVVSNLETGVSAARLYELWLSVDLASSANVLFGLYDLNGEFDVLESSALFVNSAHGIGTDIAQSGINGPSIFPITGLAMRYETALSEELTWRTAILDGVPGDPDAPDRTRVRLSTDEGALIISELQRQSQRRRLLLGGWTYTEKADPVSGLPDEGPVSSYGLYLRGETKLGQGAADVSVFGRIGVADADANQFSRFLSAGVAWNPFPQRRPEDRMGLAMAWAGPSDRLEPSGARQELAWELTYRIELTSRITLQPHLHYVVHPGADDTLDNALVAGLRFEGSIF